MRDTTGAFQHLTGQHPARACRVCGCTEHDACIHPGGRPCSWVAADLCSVCANTIAGIMRLLDKTDREAEAFVRIIVAHESARLGLTAPELRRMTNRVAPSREAPNPHTQRRAGLH